MFGHQMLYDILMCAPRHSFVGKRLAPFIPRARGRLLHRASADLFAHRVARLGTFSVLPYARLATRPFGSPSYIFAELFLDFSCASFIGRRLLLRWTATDRRRARCLWP